MSDDEFVDDFIDEYIDEDESENDAVTQATVRLDQGRLYQMLINHDLFDGVEADKQAINNVQREIKEFMVSRMKILLGMEVEKEEVQHVVHESKFNDLEVQALKMIASKVTKGKSEVEEEEVKQPTQSELNTVKAKPKANKINALGGNSHKTKPAPIKKKKVKKQAKPLPKKTAQKPRRKLKKDIAKVSTNGLDTVGAAKKDIKYLENLKNKSLEEANEIVAQRHNKPRPKATINQDMVNQHYQTKVTMTDSKMSDLGKIMKMAALKKANES